jgi:hypothetical protein
LEFRRLRDFTFQHILFSGAFVPHLELIAYKWGTTMKKNTPTIADSQG